MIAALAALLLLAASAPAAARAAPTDEALRAACDEGRLAECVTLGRRLVEREGGAAAGRALLEKACARDHADGCLWLAAAFLRDGADHDEAQFVRRFDRGLALVEGGCAAGRREACATFNAIYGHPDAPRDAPEAGWLAAREGAEWRRLRREALARACRAAPGPSCRDAAGDLAGGLGGGRDPAGAAALYALACGAGEGEACHEQALLGLAADGAPLDDAGRRALRERGSAALAARCAARGGRACLTLQALAPAKGPEKEAREKRADAGLGRECEAGSGDACRQRLLRLVAAKAPAEVLFDARIVACRDAAIPEACRELQKDPPAAALERGPVTLEVLRSVAVRALAGVQAIRAACLEGAFEVCDPFLFPAAGPDREGGLVLIAALADERLRARCEAGEPAACDRLLANAAASDPRGLTAGGRRTRALAANDRLCRAGRQAGCVEFHRRRIEEGGPPDAPAARKKLLAARAAAEGPCADGDGAACHVALAATVALNAGGGDAAESGPRAAALFGALENGWLCGDLGFERCAGVILEAALAAENADALWARALSLTERLPAVLERGCGKGAAFSCIALAELTRGGLRGALAALGKRGAEGAGGPPEAFDPLVIHFEQHWSLKPDPAAAAALQSRAVEALRASCAAGRLADCRAAARFAPRPADASAGGDDEEEPLADEPPEAAAALAAARVRAETDCKRGLGAACRQLWPAERDGSPRRLHELVEAACDGGDGAGCLVAAWRRAAGRGDEGTALDAATAALRRACDAREAAGCRTLVIFRRLGQLPAEGDAADELTLLEKGCGAGDAPTCRILAFVLLQDAKNPGSLARGRELLEKGCAGGDARSCRTLGQRRLGGTAGFVKDEAAALRDFERACALGDADACDTVKRLREKD